MLVSCNSNSFIGTFSHVAGQLSKHATLRSKKIMNYDKIKTKGFLYVIRRFVLVLDARVKDGLMQLILRMKKTEYWVFR